MDGRSSARWTRALVEGLVIVVSILLAFAIDAAWAERQERIEEAAVLDGLAREFAGYRTSLEARVAQHTDMMSAMEAILRAIDAGAWTTDAWTVEQALWLSLNPPTSDLGNGVRDALVQGGRLQIISDRALREKLAAWPGYYEEVLDDQLLGRSLVFDRLLPHMASMGLSFSAVIEPGMTWPVERTPIGSDPLAMRRLLTDPEYRALLEIRYAFWNHAREEYAAAMEAVQAILLDLKRLRARMPERDAS
jgi:hypothetical protein